jgi:hypothetical protein
MQTSCRLSRADWLLTRFGQSGAGYLQMTTVTALFRRSGGFRAIVAMPSSEGIACPHRLLLREFGATAPNSLPVKSKLPMCKSLLSSTASTAPSCAGGMTGLLVCVTVEVQCRIVGVQLDLPYAVVAPCKTNIGKGLTVVVERRAHRVLHVGFERWSSLKLTAYTIEPHCRP